MILKYSNLAFVFKKARIDYITDLVISILFVIRLFATENIVLFHILKIYSKKKMHKWLPRRKLAKDRAALLSRITYKPYTCIQRALISLATGASSSHRFVIKCAFHLVPTFLRHADNMRISVFYRNVNEAVPRLTWVSRSCRKIRY